MEVISKVTTSMWGVPFFLSLIIFLGLGLRFYYFPFDTPIVTDGFFHFVYGIKTTVDGGLPTGYTVTNTGWANFLSLIFWSFDKSDPMYLMNIQRVTSIIISVLTIIPAYSIFRRFTNSRLSLLGCILIIIEPRLLLISLEGINFTLFLFLFISSLALFLKRTNISLIFSFVCLSLASLVRYEALLMFIPFTIMYFIKFRERKSILKFCLFIAIMALILVPIGTNRIEQTQNLCFEYTIIGKSCGEDGIFSVYIFYLTFLEEALFSEHEIDETEFQEPVFNQKEQNGVMGIEISFFTGISNFLRFIGLSLLPFFIFFISLNIITRLSNRQNFKLDFNAVTLLFTSIVVGLSSSFYAYARDIEEIRYVLVFIPLFCVLSISFSKNFTLKIEQNKMIFFSLIIFSLIFSILFIETEKRDSISDQESFNVAKKIVLLTDIINNYDNDGYIKTALLFHEWPELPNVNLANGKLEAGFQKISTKKFSTLDEFLIASEQQDLKFFVIDKNEGIFEEVRENPEKYTFLKLVFDSKNEEYQNEFLVYEIDYEDFKK